MNYVIFGNYHSYEDFSLFLKSKTIEQPEAKTEYLDIPGSDGQLDLTEFFGDIKYKNRKLTFEFQTKLRHEAFYNLFETISNAINGKRLKVYLSEDEYFYFEGRIKLNEYKSNEKIGSIIIEVDSDPYKMEKFETIHEVTLTGEEKEVYLINLKKQVSPSIEVVANSGESVTLIYGDTTYMLSNGLYSIPEMTLKEGNNYIKLSGVGKIIFSYRRGKL